MTKKEIEKLEELIRGIEYSIDWLTEIRDGHTRSIRSKKQRLQRLKTKLENEQSK